MPNVKCWTKHFWFFCLGLEILLLSLFLMELLIVCRSMTEQRLAEVCVPCGCRISHRAALLGLLMTVFRHMVCSGFGEQQSPWNELLTGTGTSCVC